jgi:hypothetical protein
MVLISTQIWRFLREREREREMGGVVLVIIAASLLMGCTNLALAEKDLGVMHVGGKVLCQDCTQGWHEWAHGGKPIKGKIKGLHPHIFVNLMSNKDGDGCNLLTDLYSIGQPSTISKCWITLARSV